jgi:hypothetical protein
MEAPRMFSIIIGNPWDVYVKDGWQPLVDEVIALFNPVIAHFNNKNPKRRASFTIKSTWESVPVDYVDLVVYVVPHEDFSVLVDEFPRTKGDAGGRTVLFHGASEVYIAKDRINGGDPPETLRIARLAKDHQRQGFSELRSPASLAQLIFHEALHNKTNIGDRMHNLPSPKTALMRAVLDPKSKQSPEDIELMAEHLFLDHRGKPQRQWGKGWAAVLNKP